MHMNHRGALRALFALLVCVVGGNASASASALAPPADGHGEIRRLVSDLCSREVVLLGEDAGHGSGKTLELRVDLVQRLVDTCGFNAVLFESQLYDFLDLDHSFASKTATPAQLADAIGGLWSTTREIDPLVAFLFRRAVSGRVKVFGLDPQVGGATGWYAQRHLPTQLAASLAPARREVCERTLLQLTDWQYDETTPYDDAARARLRGCLGDIDASLAALPASNATAQVRWEAKNLSGYLDMSDDASGGLRDRLMYENVEWFRAQHPDRTKIIIWTATVHAVKTGMVGSTAPMPMGAWIHQAMGKRAAVVGFSAVTGHYARLGMTPRALPPAAAGSLESRVFTNFHGQLRYVDARQLEALGSLIGRPLNYGKPVVARWSTMLDGLLVLKEERPPDFVRRPIPQQAER